MIKEDTQSWPLASTYMHMSTCIHTYVHMCILTFLRAHTKVCAHVHMYAHTCPRMHTYVHTHMFMCAHMYTCVHVHTQMYHTQGWGEERKRTNSPKYEEQRWESAQREWTRVRGEKRVRIRRETPEEGSFQSVCTGEEGVAWLLRKQKKLKANS